MATQTVRSEFDSAYRAHFADVRRFVFHLVQDVSLADELTQDAFLKALDAWGSYRGEAPERVWLLRIARNVCLDHMRSPRSRRRAPLSLDLAEAEGREVAARSLSSIDSEPPVSVEQAALQAEMTDCVQQFVLSLPETLRTPLILHDIQSLTNPEIAQVLGCSLEAAKMRLHRARGELRKMMEQRCELFHDERNVLACLPAPPETGFVSLDEIANATPAGLVTRTGET
jgi:RNA polymerase sigma-70 factor (ECF subfamily)